MNGSTSSSARQATPARPDDTAPVRFTLTGPSRPYDERHQAIRADLADIAEAAHHFAPHYAAPVACIANRTVAVREGADDASTALVELQPGAGYALLDLSGGWAWGYAEAGHVVGYVRRECLDLA